MRTSLFPNYYDIPRDWEVLYRAISYDGGTRIEFNEYPIVKYTSCGVWISNYGIERFINLKCIKQFASVSKSEAIEQLYHRKVRQITILNRQRYEALETIKLIKSGRVRIMSAIPQPV